MKSSGLPAYLVPLMPDRHDRTGTVRISVFGILQQGGSVIPVMGLQDIDRQSDLPFLKHHSSAHPPSWQFRHPISVDVGATALVTASISPVDSSLAVMVNMG